jgi:hypothetical protein
MGRAEDLLLILQRDGVKAIDSMILDRKSESTWLDFKRVDPAWSVKSLGDANQNSYARAIGGFGNTDGGLIVWGVECTKKSDQGDVASAKCPIPNPQAFVSLLESATSRCTMPPHRGGVHNFVILEQPNIGYPVSYVPKSDDSPHQELPTLEFYCRSGSSFAKMHYSVLAGMFGKRPQPRLSIDLKLIEYRVGSVLDRGKIWLSLHLFFTLTNSGPGIARDYFVSSVGCTGPSPGCGSLALVPWAESLWHSNRADLRHYSQMSLQPDRLAPFQNIKAIEARFETRTPTLEGFALRFLVGAEGAALGHFDFEVTTNDLKSTFSEQKTIWDQTKAANDQKPALKLLQTKAPGVPIKTF